MTAASIEQQLAATRADISPRFNPPPTPPIARLIHAAALLLWIVLLGRAFVGGGLFAWSAGIAYILYDTVLLVFVFAQTLALRHGPGASRATDAPDAARATVVVAAHNEAASLPVTIAALLAQSEPAEVILIADDGSTDETAILLQREYGLVSAPDRVSAASPAYPTLRWLRLPHGGKAQALNVACALAETELVLTVDADTLLDPGALRAMRAAFAADPALVAATGVLKPLCGPSWQGRLLQWFQTYEYVRNFLSRYAWMRADGLLLISGAFACYRRAALLAVGGFDPDCLVEDYELTHRLRDHAGRQGVRWHTAVIGGAHARTDAPATPGAFLRQRRRWFGGFLQTQLWYRHMVGNPRYGHTGDGDAAGQGDRHAAAALRPDRRGAAGVLCGDRTVRAGRLGVRGHRRQAGAGPRFPPVVAAFVSTLDRSAIGAVDGSCGAGVAAGAVQLPVAAPSRRRAWLGVVHDRHAKLAGATAAWRALCSGQSCNEAVEQT